MKNIYILCYYKNLTFSRKAELTYETASYIWLIISLHITASASSNTVAKEQWLYPYTSTSHYSTLKPDHTIESQTSQTIPQFTVTA